MHAHDIVRDFGVIAKLQDFKLDDRGMARLQLDPADVRRVALLHFAADVFASVAFVPAAAPLPRPSMTASPLTLDFDDLCAAARPYLP